MVVTGGSVTVVVIPAGAVVVPTRATVVVPARPAVVPARTSPVPGAVTVPPLAIAALTVEEPVIVAAALVPVVAPPRVEELAGAPVVVRQRGRRHGLGDTRRAHASESQTRGDRGRGCDSFDVYHGLLVPPRYGQLNP